MSRGGGASLGAKLSGVAVIVLAVAVVGGGIAAVVSWETVDEGHVKVDKVKGETQGILKPGTWYFQNPITHSYETINMRPQLYTMVGRDTEGRKGGDDSIHVKNADQLNVPVDVAVTYEVTDAMRFHERWKNHENARAKLIRNPARDVVYTVGGDMTTENMTSDSGRTAMKEAISSRLNERFEGEGVKLVSVAIRDVRPPQGYMDEKRKVREEEQRVEQAELRAQQAVKEAEGQAESNRIVSESLSPELLTYRQIQAMENSSAVYVPVGNDGLPTYLNVTDAADAPSANGSVNQTAPAEGTG